MSAGYTNLRTVSYRDTIAELIARANQTHTRATGVQVFSPGDGMAFEDPEGFINPINPSLFDDATRQIAEASEALVATEEELEAAQARIDETRDLLAAADQASAAAVAEAREVAEGLAQLQETGIEVTPDMADNVLRTARAEAATAFVTNRLVVGTGDDRTVLEVLGTAVVNDLNLRGTLRGRDAILDGTLDVEQLNVTEDMAAEIGRFMSVETKKLIVTESAVMQHVTAIEGIITPEITASEARMGELIAEKASINDIQGGNLTITGHFRSGAVGNPGVIIPKNYTFQPGVEQLGVWLAPDGTAPSLGAEWGRTAGMWLDNASNVSDSKNSSPLHVRGQDGAGVRVWGGLSVGDSAGKGVITSAGGGNMIINSRLGHISFSAGRQIQATSAEMTIITSGTGVVLRTDGYHTLQNVSGSAYRQSWSGSGLLDLKMGSSSGRIYTDTSTRRAKTDISTMEPDHEWLDMRTVWYRDKNAVKAAEAVESRQAAGDCAPLTAEEHELIESAGRYTPGRIAEEGAEIDSPQVVYGPGGQVESWDYSRDAVMLTPHVREHRDKIADLESRIAELESAFL